MNVVVLTGRLTRDPELKYTQAGKAFAKFALAVSREFNKDEVDFINCTAWGKTAEIAGEYLRKGNRAGVHGSLRVGKYEVNGEKRTSVEVNVASLEFLESKGAAQQSAGGEAYSAPAKVAAAPKAAAPVDDDEDDFPF